MTAQPGEGIGLGHRNHPLLGHKVRDAAHEDRIGVLRAVAPNADPAAKHRLGPKPATADEARSSLGRDEVVAWLAPVSGGVEWPTPLDAITEA